MNKQNTAVTDIKDLRGSSTKPSLHFKLYRNFATVIMIKQNTAGTDI